MLGYSINRCKKLLLFISIIGISTCAFTVENDCYLNIERNFFNESLVNQALGAHNISQSNWALINQTLRANSKDIPRLVRERAKKLDPNPFDFPFRPLIAAKILNQVQFEIFAATLAVFKINSPTVVQEMFSYILKSHAKEYEACFGKDFDKD